MVILLYHDIIKSGDARGIYSLGLDTLKQQMLYLKENGFCVLSLMETVRMLDSAQELPPKSVVITFDDGLLSHFELAYPVLRELGFTASFFVIVEKIGQRGFLGWDQIKLLSSEGFEIGSHGLTHSLFGLLKEGDIFTELKRSKEILEQNLNQKVNSFSLPRGSPEYKHISYLGQKAGYQAIASSRIGYIKSGSQPSYLERVPIRRNDTIIDFAKILNNDRYKFLQLKIKELYRDCIKTLVGIGNYEYLRKKLLADEYANERPFPE